MPCQTAPSPLVGTLLTASLACAGVVAASDAGPPDLARYFGFDAPRIVVVDPECGPIIVADFNNNGLKDFAIVNNRKSRIEVHLQRAEPLDDAEAMRRSRVNELPQSRWFERREISVAHRVAALRAHDFDGDGRLDIVYSGQPAEIVVLRQTEGGDFTQMSRRRVRGLGGGRDGLAVADVTGGPEPEVVAIVDGRVSVFPILEGGSIGDPTNLGSGGAARQQIVAFFIEDYTGNGMQDILGVVPEDGAPLRLWLQRSAQGDAPAKAANSGKRGVLGPEMRFEMPALREAEPIRFPHRAAASIGVIERASRRMVFYDLAQRPVLSQGAGGVEREVQAEVTSFGDGDNKERAIVIADIDGDGLLDLLAADMRSNSLALYRQRTGLGLALPERFSTFREPRSLAVGRWQSGDALDVFVLSQEERTVGVSAYDRATGRLGFPQPVPIKTTGGSPVAMAHLTLRDGPALAVVVQSRRDHVLEIHRPGAPAADAMVIELTGVTRPPRSMLGADIDHDGSTDLLLFTPNEPMVMVRGVDSKDGPEALTDRVMPQFGLVQAAGPDNTALMDVDGDGKPELLIADKNFVRACAFDRERGWRVVEQVNEADATTSFVGLSALSGADESPTIVASDRANRRLVRMTREGGEWRVESRMLLSGVDPVAIHAGSFTGDGKANILCLSDDAFGVVRLDGVRYALEEFEAWRSDKESRLEHEIATGDLNGDGYLDVVVLDAREQMCQIFTFSASRKLHAATEFEVFQSRLFARGEPRTFEPSYALIADLTGDGADDLLLLAHDRVIIYPQMTAP